MKDIVYSQLNLLLRIKQSALLDETKLKRLVQAEDLSDLQEILRSTRFEKYVEEEDFFLKIDRYLTKDRLALFTWLYQEVPEESLMDLYTSRFTFHNLKWLLKAKYFGKNYDHLYEPNGKYSLETLSQAVQSKQSSVLPEEMVQAIQEVSEAIENGETKRVIDVICDRMFLVFQKNIAMQIAYPEVTEQVESFIDFCNLSVALRAKIQQEHFALVASSIEAVGQIPLSLYQNHYEEDLESILDLLKTSRYGFFFSKFIEETSPEDFLRKFEALKDEYLHQMYKKANTQAFGPLPLLKFLNDLDEEYKNLKIIVAGKRSQIPCEKIEERLRIYA